MMESAAARKKFHVSIGSVLSGLLFFSGLESLIRLGRDPLTNGVIWLLNRFAKAMLRQPPASGWTFFFLNLAVALIFSFAGLVAGTRVLRRSRQSVESA